MTLTEPKPRTEFALELTAWRDAHGWTQAQAVERLYALLHFRVRLCTYRAWEQGRQTPTSAALVRHAISKPSATATK